MTTYIPRHIPTFICHALHPVGGAGGLRYELEIVGNAQKVVGNISGAGLNVDPAPIGETHHVITHKINSSISRGLSAISVSKSRLTDFFMEFSTKAYGIFHKMVNGGFYA